MPTPRNGETQSEFVSRCVPIVLDEGTAESQEQAVAICHSYWDEAKKSVFKDLPLDLPTHLQERERNGD